MIDYEKVFLSKHEGAILDDLSTGNVVRLFDFEAEHLLNLGFIGHYALSKTGSDYVITSDGLRFCEFLHSKQQKSQSQEECKLLDNKKRSRSDKHDRIITWVSIIVANAIALATLIVSIVK